MKSSHFELEQNSQLVFSNTLPVAGVRSLRMFSRWHLFIRYKNYMWQVGLSGESLGNWA